MRVKIKARLTADEERIESNKHNGRGGNKRSAGKKTAECGQLITSLADAQRKKELFKRGTFTEREGTKSRASQASNRTRITGNDHSKGKTVNEDWVLLEKRRAESEGSIGFLLEK